MGRANGCNADAPAAFLRAHTKEPQLPPPGPPSSPKHKLKPPVPSKADTPLMGLVSSRDFVTTNALEVILATPGKVATPQRPWTLRPGFGHVPTYLKRNKAVIQSEREQVEAYLRLQQPPSDTASTVPLPEEERRELLERLKAKWVALNAAYQKLGFVTELACQIRRKEGLEAQLRQVEGDINALAKGAVVLVVQE